MTDIVRRVLEWAGAYRVQDAVRHAQDTIRCILDAIGDLYATIMEDHGD